MAKRPNKTIRLKNKMEQLLAEIEASEMKDRERRKEAIIHALDKRGLLEADIDPERLASAIQAIANQENTADEEAVQVVEKPKRGRRPRVKKAEEPAASEASADENASEDATAGNVTWSD